MVASNIGPSPTLRRASPPSISNMLSANTVTLTPPNWLPPSVNRVTRVPTPS